MIFIVFAYSCRDDMEILFEILKYNNEEEKNNHFKCDYLLTKQKILKSHYEDIEWVKDEFDDLFSDLFEFSYTTINV